MPDKVPSPFIFSANRAAASPRLARLCATWLLGLTLGAVGVIVMTSIARASDSAALVFASRDGGSCCVKHSAGFVTPETARPLRINEK